MIKNKVNIILERIPNSNIIGYEILATDPITAIQKRIAVIDNPENINPIKIRSRVIDTNRPVSDMYSRIYDIKHKSILMNQDYNIKVFVNGGQVNTDQYILNKVKQQLIVFTIIQDDDFVEVEYYIDGIAHEFLSECEESYVVKPMISDANVLIGRHNLLK